MPITKGESSSLDDRHLRYGSVREHRPAVAKVFGPAACVARILEAQWGH